MTDEAYDAQIIVRPTASLKEWVQSQSESEPPQRKRSGRELA